MTPMDWTLLVIAAGGRQYLQPVQLQKSLFIIGRTLSPIDLRVPQFYQFEAYDYGPFCRAIYDDADALENKGLIIVERPPVTRFNRYIATDPGMRRAIELRSTLRPRVSDYLQQIVEWTQAQTFNQLVTAIYDAYPEMKANSVFREYA